LNIFFSKQKLKMPKKWIILITVVVVVGVICSIRETTRRERIEKDGEHAKIYRKQYFIDESERFGIYFITTTNDTVWISEDYCCKFQEMYDKMVGQEAVYQKANPREYFVKYSK
jgi:hypothetical protein